MVSPFSISFSTMWAASAAYSSGRPRRAGNGVILPSASRTSAGRPSIIGVWNRPGAMAVTRMPERASSRAIGRTMPTMPAFDAA